MADAAQTQPSGTNSTPTEPTAPVAAATTATAAAAPTTTETTTSTDTTQVTTAEPVSTETAEGTDAPQDAAPPADAPAPLFKLPDDIKLHSDATTKFDAFLRPKVGTDGKLTLTTQEVMDHFADQARDTMARWNQQIAAKSASNEQACKQRFSPAQLAASETAIGFLTSFDPTFRDVAKRQLNDPVFVNAMRIIGERLSEDSLEVDGHAAPPKPAGRSAAERMGYAKAKSN